jgi:hypothetical protein
MTDKKKEITPEELKRILEALEEAYKKMGKKIETAVVHHEDKEELIIDNRDKDKKDMH